MKSLAIILCSVATALCGCETTAVKTTWRTNTPPSHRFTKIVALVLNASPGERRAAEDELASQVRNVPAVPAYSILSDEDLKDRERAKAILKASGADGLVLLRLVQTDKTVVYHPPVYTNMNNAYTGNFSTYSGPDYRSGYTETTVITRGEVNVFEIASGNLIWAGSSTTADPANIQDLVRQVANATREELKKENLFP